MESVSEDMGSWGRRGGGETDNRGQHAVSCPQQTASQVRKSFRMSHVGRDMRSPRPPWNGFPTLSWTEAEVGSPYDQS